MGDSSEKKTFKKQLVINHLFSCHLFESIQSHTCFFYTDSSSESQSGFRFGRCQRQPSSAIFLLSFLILEVAAFQQNIGRIGKLSVLIYWHNKLLCKKTKHTKSNYYLPYLSIGSKLEKNVFIFANIPFLLLIVWTNFPIFPFVSFFLQFKHMSYNEIDLSSHNDMPLTKKTHFLTF